MSARGLSPPAYVRREPIVIMTPNEIEVVVSLFGPSLIAQNLPALADRWSSHLQPANDTPEGRLALRNDPRLGWRFAQRLAASGDTATLAKIKGLRWINAGVAFLTAGQPTANSSAEFYHVEMANALDDCKTGQMLRACLLATDASVEIVAAALKLHADTVAAYHSLFFNVMGRRGDIEFMHGLESRHNSVSFARQQAGLSGGDFLLAVARHGPVKGVLVAEGMRPGDEESRSAMTEALQRKGVKAATEWLSVPGNAHKEIPPFVALGLDIARNYRFVAETEHLRCSGMGALINAQLELDGESVRRSIAARAAAASGSSPSA